MIWIHGGGYLTGSGNDMNQQFDYLLTKKVIIVSINYRLGVLGKICILRFLMLFHSECAENFLCLYKK